MKRRIKNKGVDKYNFGNFRKLKAIKSELGKPEKL